MKKNLISLTACLFASMIVLLTSCDKKGPDGPGVDQGPDGEVVVSGSITKDSTLSADKHWILDGVVKVKNGATLTIEPGTIVKGKYGTKATLVILRGAKINAVGTAQKPIVFTSDQPAGSRTPGDWGGIILCGRAPHNLYDPANPDALKPEGGLIDAEVTFGGTEPEDNSGTMKYCRIEFAGYVFQEGNEINGFTMCAVGRNTVLENIQVSYANDDSFEWFGGTVNCKRFISYAALDDDFDSDNGFSGLVQYGLIIRDPQQSDVSNSNGFESDGNASGSAATPLTSAVFANISAYGPLAIQNGVLPQGHKHQFGFQIRRNSSISILNSFFAGFVKGAVIDTDRKPAGEEGSIGQSKNGNLVLENVTLAGCDGSFLTWYEKSSTAAVDTAYTKTLFAADKTNKVTTLQAAGLSKLNLHNPLMVKALGAATTTNSKLTAYQGVYETANYVGAFDGVNNWTNDWTEFDPQNANYELSK